jgi:hypothetical protein
MFRSFVGSVKLKAVGNFKTQSQKCVKYYIHTILLIFSGFLKIRYTSTGTAKR